MSENSEEKYKPTIREYFKDFLDDKSLFLFRMVYDGQSYAGNDKKGKAKRNTRVSIIIPREIAENNLKFMHDWNFIIIGIKREKENNIVITEGKD